MTKQPEAIPVRLKSIFLETPNVRNYELALEGLLDGRGRLLRTIGEGRLVAVTGKAGRGKTKSSIHFAAKYGQLLLQAAVVWSPLEFLQAICREMKIKDPPRLKSGCFNLIVESLKAEPRVLFLDEFDIFTHHAKGLAQHYLEIARELADHSGYPVVLVGEEKLLPMMKINARVWSRTAAKVEFAPVDLATIIGYLSKAAGLEIQPEDAALMHAKCRGDFRPVVRAGQKLLDLCFAKRVQTIDREMVKIVLKMDLWGGN
ncbi:MAG: ATP-binding protein [Deltaproteobacteria bacterium]|nr:ATP-binding protein [Deltaproteobacteria bacterium]